MFNTLTLETTLYILVKLSVLALAILAWWAFAAPIAT